MSRRIFRRDFFCDPEIFFPPFPPCPRQAPSFHAMSVSMAISIWTREELTEQIRLYKAALKACASGAPLHSQKYRTQIRHPHDGSKRKFFLFFSSAEDYEEHESPHASCEKPGKPTHSRHAAEKCRKLLPTYNLREDLRVSQTETARIPVLPG